MIKSQKDIKKPNPGSVKLPQIKPKTIQSNISKARPSSSNNRVEQLHKNLFNKLDDIEDQLSQVKNQRKCKIINRKSSMNNTHNGLQQITLQSCNSAQKDQENDIKNSNGTNFENLSKYMPQLYSKLKQMNKEDEKKVKNSSLITKIELNQINLAQNDHQDKKQCDESGTFLTSAKVNNVISKSNQQNQEQQNIELYMSQQEIQQMYLQLYKNQFPQRKQGDLQQIRNSLLKCQKQIDGIQSSMVQILKTIGYQYKIL